ncbi:hypothetical protein ACHAXM_000306 [Skeletonema potamos]
MKWHPITAIIKPPLFPCCPTPPPTAELSNIGPVTLRNTNIPEMRVDIHNDSHCNHPTGATHIHVVGMYGTSEYPYKQMRSTTEKEMIPINRKMRYNPIGRMNEKLYRIQVACSN